MPKKEILIWVYEYAKLKLTGTINSIISSMNRWEINSHKKLKNKKEVKREEMNIT